MKKKKIKLIKAKIKLLVLTRESLYNHEFDRICCALNDAIVAIDQEKLNANKSLPERYQVAVDELQAFVINALEGNSSLEGWLSNQGFKAATFDEARNKTLDCRIRWVDWMIEQLTEQLPVVRSKVNMPWLDHLFG